MNKRTIMLGSAIMLTVLLLVGGTLAWFKLVQIPN